ncbi:MAG: hypothetical protein SGI97_01400 [candidate division Zixibacteria bacterium]|nr:hypothetical protein [candidate division Zixibacteria bacterium]
MTVKKKPTQTTARPHRVNRNEIESWKWLAPLLFAAFAVGLVILFRDFFFSSTNMIIGSDFLQAGFFVKQFIAEHIGFFSVNDQWNPYVFGGMPYIESFFSDILYPPSIIFRNLGDLWRMLSYNLVLHIFLAGVWMYLCAREFKLGKLPSLFAASCYMFAPYLVSLVAPYHDGKIFVTSLFPLVILFLERGFESHSGVKQLFNFSMFGFIIGLTLLAPHIQMTYFALLASLFFTVFKLINMLRDKRPVASLVAPGTLAAFGVVIGLGLSAIQIYPGVTYTTEFSPRADTKKGWDWATSWSMHEEEAFSLIIPEFPGVSTQAAQTYYWGKNAFKDNSESAGIIAFFLALIGLLFSRRRNAYFFGGLALFAFLYGLGATTPIFRLFFWLIPGVESLRAPSMIMFVFSFCAAMLGAMGLQAIIERKRDDPRFSGKFKYLLWGMPALLLFLALAFSASGRGMIDLWTSLFYSEAASQAVQQGVTKLDVAYANLPAIRSGAWFAFLFTALASLVIWLYRSEKVNASFFLVLIALPMFDGIRFNSRFVETVEPSQYTTVTSVTTYLQQNAGQNRVLDIRTPRSPQEAVLPQWNVQIVGGYHGNQLRWYDDLLGGVGMPNIGEPRLLNLTGVKYLIMPAGQSLPPNYFGSQPVVPVATLGTDQIFRNDNAIPRVFTASRYQVLPERSQITPLVLKDTTDLRRLVYLEEEPALAVSGESSPTDSAWFVSYGFDTVQVGVHAENNTLVVLTDNWFDAWHATVGGQPAKILRADGAFRAVAVPAGNHEILFSYHSSRYTKGKMATMLTSIYLVIIAGGYFVYCRRKPKHTITETETANP